MREGFVSFGHAMGIFAFLDGGTTVSSGIHEFTGKALLHGFFTTATSKTYDPANCQGVTTLIANLDRHLVGGTTDTTGLDFDRRTNVFEGFLENLDRFITGTLLDQVESTVNDILGGTLLTVEHQGINELGHQLIMEFRLRQDNPLGYFSSSRHNVLFVSLNYLGRLAPYLERDCLRSLTPARSRAPRTIV